MENRRPTTPDNAPRPVNRNNNFRREGDNQFEPRRYQSRDNRPQPGNDRYQSRDDRYQSRDNRYPSRDDRPRSNNGGGDNRFQGRDDQNAPRGGGRFQSRDNNYPPRGRFAPKEQGRGFKPWMQDQRPRIVSEMQVTDGKHRGKYLQSTASDKVRPTARRIREIMFRILYRRIRAGRFLDLCAGSGMVGMEAISRGALIGTFVERSARMCAHIKKNMEICGVKEGHGEMHHIEAMPFLKRMEKRKRVWDVAFYDPPYDSDYDEVLAYFGRGAALKPKGILVIEHHFEMFFPEEFGVMKRWRVVTQGETSLSFYEKQ